MLTLFADETGIAWDERIGFFMYGGIVLSSEDIKTLTSEIYTIKAQYGIESGRPMKWNNKKWQGSVLNPEKHKEVKAAVLECFSRTSGTIIICSSPHRFYHDATWDGKGTVVMRINPTTLLRTQKYAINDLLKKFSTFLGERRNGIVIVDKFGDGVRQEMTKHCERYFPYENNIVHPVIQQDDNVSIPLQVTDIVLGAVQCSLKDESEFNFLPLLRDHFWSVKTDNVITVSGFGFNIYPVLARYATYQRAKKNLYAKFHKQINA